jgi:hypothetical protein
LNRRFKNSLKMNYPSVSNKSKASFISKISSSVNPGLSNYLGLNPFVYYFAYGGGAYFLLAIT